MNHRLNQRKASFVSAFALLAGTAASYAGPLLETHAPSLTDYLPTTATPVQDVLPHDLQRVMNFDGTGRLGTSSLGANIAANPFGSAWGSSAMAGSIHLATGAWAGGVGGIALPATVPWTVGVTYNAQQDGGTHESDGYQGRNWVQTSQPELILHEATPGSGSADDDDLVYIVFGNGRYAEFKRQDASSANAAYNAFKGVNGAAGVVEYSAGTGGNPDTYTLYDQDGTRFVFFGFDAHAGAAAGQLWKKIGTGGDVAFVGHETNPLTAISTGYDGLGRILSAEDSSGRLFAYTYTNLGAAGTRLTRVVASVGGVSVAEVDYAYYTALEAGKGRVGDLKMVSRTTPLNESGRSAVDETYFRYNTTGDMRLRMVVGPHGVWKADKLAGGVEAQSDGALKPLSDMYFEYDGSNRVSSFFAAGSCGCSGAIDGTTAIFYESANGFSASAGYDAEAKTYAEVVSPPQYAGADPLIRKVFMDEVGQRGTVVEYADSSYTAVTRMGYSDTAAGEYWITGVERDPTRGTVVSVFPVDMTDIDTSADEFYALPSTTGVRFVEPTFNDGLTHPELAGLPQGSETRSTAGAGKAGSTLVYDTDSVMGVRQFSVSGVNVTRPLRTSMTSRAGAVTTLTHFAHSGGSAILKDNISVVTHPIVSVTNNGSGSSTFSTSIARKDGTSSFTGKPSGQYDYIRVADGLVVSRSVDVNSTNVDAAAEAALVPFTLPATGMNLTTVYTHDEQGRVETTESPTGRTSVIYRTDLDDDRSVVFSIPHFDGTNYHSPVSVTLTNKRGQAVQSGTIAFSGGSTASGPAGWLNHAATDLQGAVSVGTLESLSEMVYDSSGSRVIESRAYYSISSNGYDATLYAHDDLGRVVRTEAPTGDISRVVRDVRGRTIAQWVGTSDTAFSPVTGGGNMVKVSETEYDAGNTNSPGLVTKSTRHLDDSGTNTRVTEHFYDSANRRIATVSDDVPGSAVKYNGLDQITHRASYKSGTVLSANTDPTTVTSGRISYVATTYDERERPFRRETSSVNPDTGALISGEVVTDETWFDSTGRTVKTAGRSYSKTVYDSAGRVTHRYVLARDSDANYGESVGGVQSDDIVVSESQTVFDAEGRSVMNVSIQRRHDAPISGVGAILGALDSNADADPAMLTAADIEGDVSVSVVYHDSLDRVVERVSYGTAGLDNGVSSFVRPATVAARSDTALRMTTEFDAAGRVFKTFDPENTETRFEYDDMGRRTRIYANYTDGIIGGGAENDEDHVTEYAYLNGLQDTVGFFDGATTKQVTQYTYGVTKGTSPGESAIASNSLLYSAEYPDSAGATDIVRYAYNALGEEVWMQDQAGNVIETERDGAGRVTARWSKIIQAGFDNRVQRIEHAYNGLGQLTTITQRDSWLATGAILDQIAYTYHHSGAIASLEQDFNGAVLPGGDQYRVEYEYAFRNATAGVGVQGHVRTLQTLETESVADQHVLQYNYTGGVGLDTRLNRLRSVQVGAGRGVLIAEYEYQGMGRVVGMNLPEPNVKRYGYDMSTGAYHTHRDRFRDRRDQWVRQEIVIGAGGGTPWETTLIDRTRAYSRASAIQSVDHTLWGADRTYTRDGLNRLVAADRGGYFDDAYDLDMLGNIAQRDRTLLGGTPTSTASTITAANEISAWGSATGITHNGRGELTDNGDDQEYVYDVFGRLTEIRSTSSSNAIAKYLYNGLGHRIAEQYDRDASGSIDTTGSIDVWAYVLHNEAWQPVARALTGGAAMGVAAKTQFEEVTIYDPRGGVDRVLAIESDTTSSGTLDERVYPLQDWRGDVVAVLASDGDPLAALEYEEYGTPIRTMRSDLDDDGGIDLDDFSILSAQFTTADCEAAHGVTGCTADLNRDNRVDSADVTIFNAGFGDTIGDRLGDLDASAKGRGYAGRHHLWMIDTSLVDKRNRVLSSDEGRFTRRDPLGYVDGGNLYAYVRGMPVGYTDPMGLCAGCGGGGVVTVSTQKDGQFGGYEVPLGWPTGPHTRTPPLRSSECFSRYWPQSCQQFALCQAQSRMRAWSLSHKENMDCYNRIYDTALKSCRSFWTTKDGARKKIRDTMSACDLVTPHGTSPGINPREECLEYCDSLIGARTSITDDCNFLCGSCLWLVDAGIIAAIKTCAYACIGSYLIGKPKVCLAACILAAVSMPYSCISCATCRAVEHTGCILGCGIYT